MLGDGTSVGYGVRSLSEKYGYDFPFLHIRDTLRRMDFVFGNLEAPLSDLGRNNFVLSTCEFRGSPSSIPSLHDAGFRVLSLANNHMLQHGRAVFSEVALSLRKAGIMPIGLLMDNGKTKMEVIDCNGQRVGFIGYSLWPSEVYESENNVFTMVAGDEDRILSDIHNFAPQVDHLCVSIHWGYEFVNHPSNEQIELGHAMIEAGARCVLGHHPHVLQGIEQWDGGLIAYSLGNFVFDMPFHPCQESIVLELLLDQSGLIQYQIHPVKIDNRFRPTAAVDEDATNILSRMQEYNHRIIDPYFEQSRRTPACKDQSVRMKIHIQKLRDHYFIANIWKFPWRFLFTKLFRKTKNLISGSYRKNQYQLDISTREQYRKPCRD